MSLDPAVAAEYTRMVAAAAPRIEAALSPRVLANRVAVADTRGPTLVLHAWRVERGRYRARLRRLAAPGRSVLLTDVRRCYPSIRPAAVGVALERAGVAETIVRATVGLLERLPVEVDGLPIGPVPSAVLANAVLADVDARLRTLGLDHLRWVDDVVVALPTPGAAVDALAVIDAALRSVGLERHVGKTRVVEPRQVLAAAVSRRSG